MPHSPAPLGFVRRVSVEHVPCSQHKTTSGDLEISKTGLPPSGSLQSRQTGAPHARVTPPPGRRRAAPRASLPPAHTDCRCVLFTPWAGMALAVPTPDRTPVPRAGGRHARRLRLRTGPAPWGAIPRPASHFLREFAALPAPRVEWPAFSFCPHLRVTPTSCHFHISRVHLLPVSSLARAPGAALGSTSSPEPAPQPPDRFRVRLATLKAIL